MLFSDVCKKLIETCILAGEHTLGLTCLRMATSGSIKVLRLNLPEGTFFNLHLRRSMVMMVHTYNYNNSFI
jgi:hypothetical protein